MSLKKTISYMSLMTKGTDVQLKVKFADNTVWLVSGIVGDKYLYTKLILEINQKFSKSLAQLIVLNFIQMIEENKCIILERTEKYIS